jgi:hypothetical protein
MNAGQHSWLRVGSHHLLFVHGYMIAWILRIFAENKKHAPKMMRVFVV